MGVPRTAVVSKKELNNIPKGRLRDQMIVKRSGMNTSGFFLPLIKDFGMVNWLGRNKLLEKVIDWKEKQDLYSTSFERFDSAFELRTIMTNIEGCQMSQNMIIEILSILPVKSLVRFRCVCKYWNSFIRSSSFIHKHHYHCHNSAQLVVHHYNQITEKIVFGLFPDKKLASVPLEYHNLDYIQMPTYLEAMIGPFNGILCFYDGIDKDHVAMWNLSTRETRSVPVPHPDLPPFFWPFIHHFGIGLDLVTNDLKIVWMRYYWDDKTDNPYNYRVIAVYTLRTDSWRLFEVDFTGKGAIQDSLYNTYNNGSYYWLTIQNDDDYYMILSFDMANETFRDLPAPPDIPGPHWGDLAMYNDSIAMLLFDYHQVEKYFNIWVMEEDGVWSKPLIIGPLLEIERPLGIWKNGDVFFENSTSQLLLYNYNVKQFKDIGVRGPDFCLKIFMFKESLVPIKGVNECLKVDRSACHYYQIA
ncbi:F-box/kelch-repeat protein At3g06240-like [Cornus florida]|uniref:F-box/kelch-repeat protein At3g06240-like n=1 Tax=Cornus florida TaxID=4283 RepID=UPI0028A2709F|nr:F-box/kelch-repeat protein At3g06240-like [Cornus florida]